MAVKRTLLSKTTTTKNMTRNTGTMGHTVMIDIFTQVSDSHVFYNAGANPARTEIPALCSYTLPPPCKQSYPTANLNSRILPSGQQTRRGTNMKKVSRLPTWMAVNSNGKCSHVAMTHTGEPNSAADTAETPRKIIRSLPTVSTVSHNSPPPVTSNLSNAGAAVAAKQILIEASAKYLLRLASETEQPPPNLPPKLVRPAATIPLLIHAPAMY